MTIKKDLKASGTDLGTESVNVQENAAQVLYSKILVCIVNTKVEEVVEKAEEMMEKVEEVGEEVEADMSESVASGIDQVRERFFLIYIENSVCLPGSINSRLSCNVFCSILAGLHKLWYPVVRDMSTWSKFGAHGEHGDVFLFSNLGAL